MMCPLLPSAVPRRSGPWTTSDGHGAGRNRLKSGLGNAMLASNSIYPAWRSFQRFRSCTAPLYLARNGLAEEPSAAVSYSRDTF